MAVGTLGAPSGADFFWSPGPSRLFPVSYHRPLAYPTAGARVAAPRRLTAPQPAVQPPALAVSGARAFLHFRHLCPPWMMRESRGFVPNYSAAVTWGFCDHPCGGFQSRPNGAVLKTGSKGPIPRSKGQTLQKVVQTRTASGRLGPPAAGRARPAQSGPGLQKKSAPDGAPNVPSATVPTPYSLSAAPFWGSIPLQKIHFLLKSCVCGYRLGRVEQAV